MAGSGGEPRSWKHALSGIRPAALFRGMYPPLYDRSVEPGTWHANYVRTYLERDLRSMINVKDMAVFQRFLRLCAGRTGQLLNMSGLASDTGVSVKTVGSWLSMLQAGYLVHLLQPYHRNFRKRLTKSPKLYFLDTGLAAYLMGITSPAQMAAHPLRGALFETYVVVELLKAELNRGREPRLFFWRDHRGREIDVILERGGPGDGRGDQGGSDHTPRHGQGTVAVEGTRGVDLHEELPRLRGG